MKQLCTGSRSPFVAIGMAAFASLTLHAQSSNTPQAPAAGSQVTVSGCIQREADYRKAKDAGRGGVGGTGVGAVNEFVLINASMAEAAASGAAQRPAPTGTAGATNLAYELTGTMERQAEQYIGRRVEISGMLKAAEVTASGRPTGAATAGKPAEGIDVVSADLKLRELEIASIRQASGTCATN